jgi:hypothetical protein
MAIVEDWINLKAETVPQSSTQAIKERLDSLWRLLMVSYLRDY